MKKNLKIPLIIVTALLTALLAAATASAQPAPTQQRAYTLDELYRSALDHAEQIGIAGEAVAIAEFTRKQALSVLIPTLSAFGNYRRFSEKEVYMGTVIQPEWDSSYGLKFGQSVTLNGRELTALHVAEYGIDKSRADLAGAKETYLFYVTSAYYDVAKVRQAVFIAEANVQRLRTHRDAVSLRLKLGDVPKTELFRTEAELAKSDADLIQVQNTLELARAFLARLAGLDDAFEIVEPEPAASSTTVTALDDLKQEALANRAELKSRAMEEQMAAGEVDYKKGAYWPRLGYEAAWVRMEQDPEPLLDESKYFSAYITFDLFDGGLRRAQVSEARARHKQAQLAQKDAQRSIAIETEQAWRDWHTQKSLITSFESQLRYAGENYAAVIRLFENGMANSVDVMDANTLLVTAERQLSEARYNMQLALLGLDRATGIFLIGIENRLSHTPQKNTEPLQQ